MEKLMESMGAVAEMVGLYYRCLVNSGIAEDSALVLTVSFQEHFLSQANKKAEEKGGAEK